MAYSILFASDLSKTAKLHFNCSVRAARRPAADEAALTARTPICLEPMSRRGIEMGEKKYQPECLLSMQCV